MCEVLRLASRLSDAVSTLEQVEKAPTVLKAGVKKEEAEELQKKLEAGAIRFHSSMRASDLHIDLLWK